MISQLVEDLVHLERRRQGLDEDGGLDRAPLDAERILGEAEHIVPEPSLEMGFHLG
jgi:hypothetical protein